MVDYMGRLLVNWTVFFLIDLTISSLLAGRDLEISNGRQVGLIDLQTRGEPRGPGWTWHSAQAGDHCPGRCHQQQTGQYPKRKDGKPVGFYRSYCEG